MPKFQTRVFPLQDEQKLETYDRPPHEAVFDRIDLILTFLPGKDGRGMIVKSFLDAIPYHDEVVKKIEDKKNEIDELKLIYRKKNRLFRNLDSAWNVMLENNDPVAFHEYLELIPKMKNIEQRLTRVTDVEIKAKITAEHNRYKLLHPRCSNQLKIYTTYSEARGVRDAALQELVTAEKQLARLFEEEKQKANRISDDHVRADLMKRTISEIFPNVHGENGVEVN
jgi:hypothetical protein